MRSTDDRAGISFQPLGEGTGILLGPQQQPLARYSWRPSVNHPYFDEVRPLAHRGVLTNHAPHDHRWHHGLWWSWKFLNDVLFWEDHPEYGGNRVGLGRSVVEEHTVGDRGDGVLITERLSWRVDDTQEVLLTEERRITAILETGVQGAWALDWDQTWTATTDVELAVTPWPETTWGGYAGLNYRAARAMVAGETITGAGGLDTRDTVHGQRMGWAAYAGTVDGAEVDTPGDPAHGGIALLQHPDNSGYPSPVYAFSAVDDFGFLATAPLMHGPRTLAQGERLRVRTRVLVFDTVASAADLDHAHNAYAATSRDVSVS